MPDMMKLAGDIQPDTYNQVLSETINNGLKAIFILMSLAGGVAVPMLISRKESVKHMHLLKKIT